MHSSFIREASTAADHHPRKQNRFVSKTQVIKQVCLHYHMYDSVCQTCAEYALLRGSMKQLGI